jgi:hypothetical protein
MISPVVLVSPPIQLVKCPEQAAAFPPHGQGRFISGWWTASFRVWTNFRASDCRDTKLKPLPDSAGVVRDLSEILREFTQTGAFTDSWRF